MSPACNGGFALYSFKHGNAIDICNGIMFDFYLGLPNIVYFSRIVRHFPGA